MSTISYDGWVPPTLDEIDFQNCTLAAKWLTAVVTLEYYHTQEFDAPIAATYDYILSFVPDLPSTSQALDWYSSNDSVIFDYMVSFAIVNCTVDTCKVLQWSGDPDLAGIGMMFVYYLAAALATLYFVVLMVDRANPFENKTFLGSFWDVFIAAFHKSTGSFLDAALIFCISVQIAGTYRHASGRIHPDKTHSVYWLTNATYMGMFTIFPPLLLQIATRGLRQSRARLLFWLVVIAFTVTNIAMYYSLRLSPRRQDQMLDRASALSEVLWLDYCDPVKLRQSLDYAMIAVEVLLGVNFFVWIYQVLASPLPLKRDKKTLLDYVMVGARRKTDCWARIARLLKLVNGCLCCLAMWALLGLFTRYRRQVEDTMGSIDDDAQWSFGQVLSLATWAPVAIELLAVWIEGPKDDQKGGTEGKDVVQEVKLIPDGGGRHLYTAVSGV